MSRKKLKYLSENFLIEKHPDKMHRYFVTSLSNELYINYIMKKIIKSRLKETCAARRTLKKLPDISGSLNCFTYYLFEFFKKSGMLISTGFTVLSGCGGLLIPVNDGAGLLAGCAAGFVECNPLAVVCKPLVAVVCKPLVVVVAGLGVEFG